MNKFNVFLATFLITLSTGIFAQSVNLYELTDTWNAGGTDFDAIKMTVTDTASGAGSNLINLTASTGGSFVVDKAGNLTVTGTATASGINYLPTLTDVDISGSNLTVIGPSAFATATTNLDGGDLVLKGGDAATTGIGTGGDVILRTGKKGNTGVDGIISMKSSDDITLFSVETANGDFNGLVLFTEYDLGTMAFGWEMSLSEITGFNNYLWGWEAGENITTGGYNLGIGSQTLGGNVAPALTGSNNVAIGHEAGRDLQGAAGWNTFIGVDAGLSMTTSSKNTFVGYFAGSASTGESNTIIGYRAGDNINTGTHNIVIGADVNAPASAGIHLSLIHISEPTRLRRKSRMPSSA